MNSLSPLPSYRNPPVIETVVSVQFDPTPTFGIAHLGLLWQQFRSRFPKVEQKAPLSAVVEQLGITPIGRVQVQLSDEPSARLWFINDTADELIQVQPDRFVRNWRRVQELGNPYPRYEEHVKPEFLRDYETFCAFLRQEKLGEIAVNQCEVTYINHILPNKYWSSHSELSAVFRGWAADYPTLSAHPIEAANLRVAHLLRSETGEFLGRLHVAVQSAFVEADRPVFVLTLTARGRPISQSESGIIGFVDLGRRAIVTTFDKITTPEMHEIWGKIE